MSCPTNHFAAITLTDSSRSLGEDEFATGREMWRCSRYVKEKRKSCCGLPCTDRGRESKTVPYDKITDCDVQETWFELVLAGFTILHPWICLEDGCVHAIRLSDPTGRAQNKQGFPSCTFDLDQG